ncbi:uncharacterized protein B0H18DRAFT_866948 [Fomitopsis serialis]|uniref:uncharacterized protein n=1 Tax=Fomitopsis serialis TaxID=139415 RepID=UPI002008C96A|nr:uncharacterized protein B0H18DRAFT_866948 [Neoantrodia serialis]KAH9937246.1 hypothetical protein B0H18DRAFT_866948 [Neoantrodia serialis]
MAADTHAVFSLYRTFHREIRLLPTNYLRHFFRIKLSDDARTLLETHDDQLRAKKMKRVHNELKKLRLANRGVWEKFDHVLDLAYGRKGKLRWELLQPIMTDPSSPPPDPIIPSVETSRPPVASAELTALLISDASHRKRALYLSRVRRPHLLPKRADPDSEDAQIFGRFSKRREVHIRRDYFQKNLRMLYPPLEVGVEQGPALQSQERRVDKLALQQAGIRPMALQDAGIMEEVHSLATTGRLPNSEDSAFANHQLSPRFLKRRFASLLARLPILTYSRALAESGKRPPGRTDMQFKGYMVSLSPDHHQHNRTYDADDSDTAWYQWSIEQDNRQREEARRNRQEDRLRNTAIQEAVVVHK